MEFLKKAGLSFWFNAAAALLALVGTILFIVTNASAGYALGMGELGVVAGIVAVLLLGGATYLVTKFGGDSPIVAAMNLVALVLVMVVVGLLLSGRAELASGLFTWESSNLVGWGVFYTSVVGAVFLLLAVLVTIVGGFLAKKAEA